MQVAVIEGEGRKGVNVQAGRQAGSETVGVATKFPMGRQMAAI